MPGKQRRARSPDRPNARAKHFACARGAGLAHHQMVESRRRALRPSCGRRSSALTRAMRCDAARSCRVRASSRSVPTILRYPPRSRGEALRCSTPSRGPGRRMVTRGNLPGRDPSRRSRPGRPRRPRAGLILCRGGPLKQDDYWSLLKLLKSELERYGPGTAWELWNRPPRDHSDEPLFMPPDE